MKETCLALINPVKLVRLSSSIEVQTASDSNPDPVAQSQTTNQSRPASHQTGWTALVGSGSEVLSNNGKGDYLTVGCANDRADLMFYI
jgi:hypothetical protein